jgi:hypothetical protein
VTFAVSVVAVVFSKNLNSSTRNGLKTASFFSAEMTPVRRLPLRLGLRRYQPAQASGKGVAFVRSRQFS